MGSDEKVLFPLECQNVAMLPFIFLFNFIGTYILRDLNRTGGQIFLGRSSKYGESVIIT